MSEVPVTLVIPTRDGGPLFRAALRALAALEPRPRRVLVLDSGSSDGTAEAAMQSGCEVIRIPPDAFDHGATRQLGAERAGSELVAFLVQDALPEAGYLAPLVAAFADPRVAGATARILPRDDGSPLARRTVLASPLAGAERRVIEVDPGAFAALSGAERRALCLFDDVASMARRSLLLEHPFPRTMMGEDQAFAEQVLRAGHALVFEPRAVVRHSHEYGPLAAFRRYRDDARFAARRFGARLRPGLKDVARGLAYEVREDLRALRGLAPLHRLVSVLRSPPLRLGQVLGQWWGSRPEAAP